MWRQQQQETRSDAEPDDTALIRQFVEQRDEAAFKLLMERYQERAFRLILSVLGPRAVEEARDVAQEVFIRVFRQLAGFRGECAFGTWLYRIAYNCAMSCRQGFRARAPHLPLEALAEKPLTEKCADPLALAMHAERRAYLLACLESLPETYRIALNLFYWMECSVEEISAYLGAPAGTVKSYLHRGRQKLFEELKKRGWEDEELML